ncbi:hypothetical protein [Parerythrobacter lacustris]|uniref:Uncharacterized protein n=1 Tax=Parerythrobacter lacustris TaxID=2969984 RepID=A0ABT1XU04_9SPHN|nr:hypothetical protein [Parerythrobacter lacustris]MCR2834734.1 hypothetical protein [Parerythrobacter lacustris]
MRKCVVTSIFFGAALVAGCKTPYGLSLSDPVYDEEPLAGRITYTDPKLYRRGALINERREETEYLDDLIEDSKTASFTPEIVRQLEVVTSLSAALGLKFDPAAGTSYTRTEEQNELKQELDTLRLQMEVDQLKRDIELARAKLPEQTEPSGPIDGDESDTPASGPGAPNSVDGLAAAVNKLQADLAKYLASNVQGLTATSITANPIDVFYDRQTYREILNGERNAVSLDELHDRNGASLVRLNMTATVFPPMKSHRATFGQLKFSVTGPDMSDETLVPLYRDWLARVSTQASQRVGTTNGFEKTTLGSSLERTGDLLDLVRFEYSTSSTNTKCRGLAVDQTTLQGCQVMWLATPRFTYSASGTARSPDIAGLVRQFPPQGSPDTQLITAALGNVDFDRFCRPDARTVPLAGFPPDAQANQGKALDLANALTTLRDFAPALEFQAQSIANNNSIGTIYFKPLEFSDRATIAQADALIESVKRLQADYPYSCGAVGPIGPFTVPSVFKSALAKEEERARFYSIGPKQQVQIVSSQARAAESIALAASLAGSVPTQGIGADAALGFGRNAVGRADALERVPLVVAFGDAGSANPEFGWMMGPRSVLDPKKQELRFAQGLRPQDLSVDLIVPGWWPYIDLVSSSAWSPDWEGRGGRSGASARSRTTRVDLSPSTADYDNITARILGNASFKVASIDGAPIPSSIVACSNNVSIIFVGPQLWRADRVVIGGKSVDGSAIKVLPDLSGIVVNVASVDFPTLSGASGASAQVEVQILTPYGRTRSELLVAGLKKDGCAAKPAKPDEQGK